MTRPVVSPLSLAATFLATVLIVACDPTPVEVPDADAGIEPPPAPVAAITSITPEPGPFNGGVTVTLTTDRPATIFVTTDGSDPRVTGGSRSEGDGLVTFELTKTTTLTFFSRTAEGAEEAVRSMQFVRAGAAKGTVSGVVVVNTIALGHEVALFVGTERHELGRTPVSGELPFTLTGLDSGTHRLRAVSDQNDDGTFVPLLELTSPSLEVNLDLDDPFRASAEGLRLHLGAPAPGLCAMQGTVRHPRPAAGETLRVSAVAPGAFGGGGVDPAALLGQLQEGFLIPVNGQQTEYRYLLNDLEPGTYIPVPLLTTIGAGGLSLNLQANPLQTFTCAADRVVTADVELGPVVLTGTVTLLPQTPPMGSTWGVVAAKNVSITRGLQAVLMPALFAPGAEGELLSGFNGRGLRASSPFALRAFTSIDPPGQNGSAGNPLFDALGWAVMPFGAAPPHATLNAGSGDETLDFAVPLP